MASLPEIFAEPIYEPGMVGDILLPRPATSESAESLVAFLQEHGFTGTDRLGRKWVDGKEVKGDEPPAARWVPTQRAKDSGAVPVEVDVAKLDSAWQKDAGFHVPPGGGADKVKYANAQAHLAKGGPVEAPEVTVDPDGTVSFTDGRHRAAAARDAGHKTMVVTVPKEQADRLRTVAGTGQDVAPAPASGHAYPPGYTPPKSLSPGVSVGPNPKLADATRPALSAPEADAVTAYTDVSVYRSLNEALKSGGPLPRPGAVARLLGAKNVGGVHDKLQAAFAKAPVSDAPMTLRRGLNSRDPEKLGQHFLSNRGKVVTLPGYQSTSAADVPEGTDAFTEPGGGYKGNVKFTIHAVHGLDVRPYSKFPAEDEVLLNHGGEYHVGRVEKRDDGWHVELFQLPPKGVATHG
jgi:hypothetical protein